MSRFVNWIVEEDDNGEHTDIDARELHLSNDDDDNDNVPASNRRVSVAATAAAAAPSHVGGGGGGGGGEDDDDDDDEEEEADEGEEPNQLQLQATDDNQQVMPSQLESCPICWDVELYNARRQPETPAQQKLNATRRSLSISANNHYDTIFTFLEIYIGRVHDHLLFRLVIDMRRKLIENYLVALRVPVKPWTVKALAQHFHPITGHTTVTGRSYMQNLQTMQRMLVQSGSMGIHTMVGGMPAINTKSVDAVVKVSRQHLAAVAEYKKSQDQLIGGEQAKGAAALATEMRQLIVALREDTAAYAPPPPPLARRSRGGHASSSSSAMTSSRNKRRRFAPADISRALAAESANDVNVLRALFEQAAQTRSGGTVGGAMTGGDANMITAAIQTAPLAAIVPDVYQLRPI